MKITSTSPYLQFYRMNALQMHQRAKHTHKHTTFSIKKQEPVPSPPPLAPQGEDKMKARPKVSGFTESLADGTFRCLLCKGKAFKGREEMRSHNLKEHVYKKWFACPQCSRIEATAQNLANHILKHHPIIRCKKCGKLAKDQHQLDVHMIRHHAI